MVKPIAEQGDILSLTESSLCVLVLSKDFFNQTGLAVVCPVVRQAPEDALHIPVATDSFSGTALCEQLKTLDLNKRYFKKLASLSFSQIQEITDAVQSIFDYFPFG